MELLKPKTTYKLILKDSDQFLSIEKESNEGQYACGDYTYSLGNSRYLDSVDFETDNLDVATRIANTSKSVAWYSSSKEEPVIPVEYIGNILVVKVHISYDIVKKDI